MRSIPSQEGVGTTIGMGTAEGAEVSYARGILSDAGMEEGTDHEFLPVGDGGPATAAFEGGEIVAYSAAIPDMAILYLEACDTTEMARRFGSPLFVFSEAPLATMRSVMGSARAGHEPASKASIRDRGSVKMRGRCPDAHGLSLLTLLVRLVRPRVVAARRPSMESGIVTDRTPSALTRPTRLQGGSMIRRALAGVGAQSCRGPQFRTQEPPDLAVLQRTHRRPTQAGGGPGGRRGDHGGHERARASGVRRQTRQACAGVREKAIVLALRAPEGDFRDWDAIRNWAHGIAEALKADAQT